jgi:hypothetical protein
MTLEDLLERGLEKAVQELLVSINASYRYKLTEYQLQ